MLKNGDFVCVSILQIVLQGREAVKQAVKAAKKEATKPRVATPALLVTKENLSKLDLSLVSAPAGYKP